MRFTKAYLKAHKKAFKHQMQQFKKLGRPELERWWKAEFPGLAIDPTTTDAEMLVVIVGVMMDEILPDFHLAS